MVEVVVKLEGVGGRIEELMSFAHRRPGDPSSIPETHIALHQRSSNWLMRSY